MCFSCDLQQSDGDAPGTDLNRRVIALLLLLGCYAEAPAAVDLVSFDQQFSALLEADGVPGGAYVIVQDGAIARSAGHGSRERGGSLAVTPETVFRLASVSKPMAAQLTSMLVKDGFLSWDEPLRRHVPEFRLADSTHSDSIQLQHLLSQSSGIVPNAYDNLLNASQSVEQILPNFADVDSTCRPGSCYTYQNVLFALIEPVIESTTRQSFETLMSERIFEPLGMQQSSIGLNAFRASENRARAHVRSSRFLPWMPVETNANYYAVSAAAGVNASANDMGQWLIAQMGNREDVLNAEQLAELTRPRIRTSRELRRRAWRDLLTNAHYGLGWRIYEIGDDTLYLHSGWVRGFVAEVAYSRQRQIGIAVLLNAETRALNAITTSFWSKVLSEE